LIASRGARPALSLWDVGRREQRGHAAVPIHLSPVGARSDQVVTVFSLRSASRARTRRLVSTGHASTLDALIGMIGCSDCGMSERALRGSAREGVLADESSDEVLEGGREKGHDVSDLLVHVNDGGFAVGSTSPVVQGDHVVTG
jgi:hypothetical protein